MTVDDRSDPNQPPTDLPGLEAKVAFLSQPGAYPQEAGPVVAHETHMSWVFLTAHHAYKMKKPIRLERLDFSTLERRRQFCGEEVQLNRRLAAEVYLGTVPLTVPAGGGLVLGGDGPAVEWLVRMRRLPAAGTLEAMALSGRLGAADLAGFVRRMAAFYRQMRREPMPEAEYRQRFRGRLAGSLAELRRPEFAMPGDVVFRACDRLSRFVDVEGVRLDERVRQGRVVEGHGDLRPEHVYLAPEPAVVDCLEFDRDLRLADPADELGYLAMECDLLGATHVHRWLFDSWAEVAADHPADDLVDFYKGCRALHRAKLSVWHVERPGRHDRGHWLRRARGYVDLAASYAERLP